VQSFWRNGWARAGAALAVLVSLSACNTTSTESPAASAPPPPAAVAPPPYAGLASGPLGQALDAASRSAANKAEKAALSSGDTKTWRGDNGAYGYVTLGAANGDCRDFTHTIYINGRPKIGKGSACQGLDGWKLKG
jgi:surface antigen